MSNLLSNPLSHLISNLIYLFFFPFGCVLACDRPVGHPVWDNPQNGVPKTRYFDREITKKMAGTFWWLSNFGGYHFEITILNHFDGYPIHGIHHRITIINGQQPGSEVQSGKNPRGGKGPCRGWRVGTYKSNVLWWKNLP